MRSTGAMHKANGIRDVVTSSFRIPLLGVPLFLTARDEGEHHDNRNRHIHISVDSHKTRMVGDVYEIQSFLL